MFDGGDGLVGGALGCYCEVAEEGLESLAHGGDGPMMSFETQRTHLKKLFRHLYEHFINTATWSPSPIIVNGMEADIVAL